MTKWTLHLTGDRGAQVLLPLPDDVCGVLVLSSSRTVGGESVVDLVGFGDEQGCDARDLDLELPRVGGF